MRREQSIQLPAFHVRADIASYNAEAGTVDMVFSTGAPVRRYDWFREEYYDEVLSMEPGHVRLDRLNAGAPLLDTHDRWSLDSVIGVVTSAEIRDGKGYATVRLSGAEKDADRVAKIRDGVVRNVSVGYAIHSVERTPPDREAGKIAQWRVTSWTPLEISAVPVPADPGAQFRGQEPAGEVRYPCVVITRGEEAATAAAQESRVENANNAAAGERAEETAVDPAAQARAAEEARAAAEAAVRAERERVAEIRQIASPYAFFRELADTHVTAGTTPTKFREIILDELAKRHGSDDNLTGVTGADIRVSGPANIQRRAAGIENALLHRYDPRVFKLTDDGRDFRGYALIELAREDLESRGIRTRGMSKMEITQRVLSVAEISFRAAGLMATTDFPSVLANVANKSLRSAYDAYPQTFRPLVRETRLPDFKPVSRVQLGEAPQLDRVNEHGEFKRGAMGEGAESYSIATYGKIVGITRQVIINDDLNAFTRIPANFGVAAAQLESDLVWAQILGNPTLGNDSTALFHANHKNLAGSGGAIAAATVSAGRLAMTTQTGLDGKTVLNLTPSYIVVSETKLTAAEQFLYAPIYPTSPTGATPPSLQRLTLISEPRLDNGIARFGIAGSATAWYLAANPAQIDIVELAYLEGTDGLFTESRMGFEIDGVEVKVRMDAGAKVIDFRGVYKDPGA